MRSAAGLVVAFIASISLAPAYSAEPTFITTISVGGLWIFTALGAVTALWISIPLAGVIRNSP